MSCDRARRLDLAAFVADPTLPEWSEFRSHYPGCPDCSAELEAWNELEAGLRTLAPRAGRAAHPEPELLAAFDADPRSLPVERWQSVQRHLDGCKRCADELAALRSFDFARAEAGAPVRASDALRQLGRALGEGLRRAAAGLAGGAREAAEWTLPVGEPAVQFQSAGEAPESRRPTGVLVGLAGGLAGRAFALLEGETRIGRAPDCELRLEDPDLARVEARVRAAPGRVEIESANPRQPVRLNGEPVERGVLADGDRVEIGAERFEFRSVAA
jgi:hypothetical protein